MLTYTAQGKAPSGMPPEDVHKAIREVAAELVASLPINKLKRIFEVTVRDPDTVSPLTTEFEQLRLNRLKSENMIEVIVKLTV